LRAATAVNGSEAPAGDYVARAGVMSESVRAGDVSRLSACTASVPSQ
jgi:hypothetical protein